MLPLIQAEVSKRWSEVISTQSMVDFVAVSESTPGPFAVNMATYVGAEMGGVFGSFCATLGVVLPSFVIILIVAKCYDAFRQSRVVKGCMSGLKPAVVGLIGNAVLTVLMTVFFPADCPCQFLHHRPCMCMPACASPCWCWRCGRYIPFGSLSSLR